MGGSQGGAQFDRAAGRHSLPAGDWDRPTEVVDAVAAVQVIAGGHVRADRHSNLSLSGNHLSRQGAPKRENPARAGLSEVLP